MPEEKKKQKSDQDIKKDAADPVDAKTKPWRPPKKIPPKEDDEE